MSIDALIKETKNLSKKDFINYLKALQQITLDKYKGVYIYIHLLPEILSEKKIKKRLITENLIA